VVVKVVLPATLPAVMTGLRLGLGRGVVGVIVAEMYVSLAGVGQLLQLYGNAGRTAELIALATLVALCGSAGVVGLRRLETRLSPWRRDLEV
jgi:NitT/TauT family transport system permease protein